ncbi:MAG: hypothetical protein ACRCTP_23225 [Aeromonas popoffii]|uniref:hypothetical protein n=1 Tax=Aeromonas popoffii TaxID=70856 RepID=UPI003F4194E5
MGKTSWGVLGLLFAWMSKHSPHQARRQPLVLALQALVASGEIQALVKAYQP